MPTPGYHVCLDYVVGNKDATRVACRLDATTFDDDDNSNDDEWIRCYKVNIEMVAESLGKNRYLKEISLSGVNLENPSLSTTVTGLLLNALQYYNNTSRTKLFVSSDDIGDRDFFNPWKDHSISRWNGHIYYFSSDLPSRAELLDVLQLRYLIQLNLFGRGKLQRASDAAELVNLLVKVNASMKSEQRERDFYVKILSMASNTAVYSLTKLFEELKQSSSIWCN